MTNWHAAKIFSLFALFFRLTNFIQNSSGTPVGHNNTLTVQQLPEDISF
jgi:hypothetical protein